MNVRFNDSVRKKTYRINEVKPVFSKGKGCIFPLDACLVFFPEGLGPEFQRPGKVGQVRCIT